LIYQNKYLGWSKRRCGNFVGSGRRLLRNPLISPVTIPPQMALSPYNIQTTLQSTALFLRLIVWKPKFRYLVHNIIQIFPNPDSDKSSPPHQIPAFKELF